MTTPPIPATSAVSSHRPPRPIVGAEPPVFPGGRDRSLPVPAIDLDRLLLAQPELTPGERLGLEHLQRRLSALFHHELHASLGELKERYAPLDPDALDERRLWRGRPDANADERFLSRFESALIKANFQKLNRQLIVEAVSARNSLGLDYVPNFGLFEHLNVYVRGRCEVIRKVRNMSTRFRSVQRNFEAYRRVVIVLKFKSGDHLDDYIRDDVVYLRMYRDVPFAEMDVHLPEQGTTPRLRWFDRAQIASPLLAAITKVVFGGVLLSFSPMALASVLAIPVGASLKSFFGFRQTKSRHLHFMIRHLYYLTQANNSSVLARLIDSAEEEEYKETLLAYYLLWQQAEGSPVPWDQSRLDAEAERFLRDRAGLDTDFEVGDALQKLLRLGLVGPDDEGNLQAVPIELAIERLDARWESTFRSRPPIVQQIIKEATDGLCQPMTSRLE
jgi:hypothetical protein